MSTAVRVTRQPEWMDDDGVDPADLRRALRFIRRINRGLGYNRHVTDAVLKLGAQTVLDVATGSADLCQLLGRQGVTCVGLDRHAETLAVARDWASGVPLVQGDALRLPLADASVDVACAAMFLHHLDPPDRLAVVGELVRVSRRGVVIADLLCNRRARFWIHLLTLAADPMTRHDARLSVKQAMTWHDAQSLADTLPGARWSVRRTGGHRFLLVGEKGRP